MAARRDNLALDLGPYLAPFFEIAPYKPYCTNDPSAGLRIRPLVQALAYWYLQHNPPPQVGVILKDLDRRVCDPETLCYCWEQKHPEGPEPNGFAINRDNGHAHLWWYLASPVTRTSAARQAPLSYLAAVELALCHKIGADPCYAGLIAKNPAHKDWLVEIV